MATVRFTSTYNPLPHTERGVTYSGTGNGIFNISGRATGGNSYFRLYVNRTAFPSSVTTNNPIAVKINMSGTGSSAVYLDIVALTSSTSTRLALTNQSTTITIPSGYTGISVNIQVNSGNTVNLTYDMYWLTNPFTPRLSEYSPTRMRNPNSPYWYNGSYNPYYASGYGLPNCTCYAWGRWYEIMRQRPTGLGLHNAETWWNETVGFSKGQVPKLGSIICFADGPYSGLGHVAVLEQINSDGTYTFSNSGYNYKYFYLRTGSPSNNYGYERAYRLQGFIYLPTDYDPDTPIPVPPTELDRPLWFYIKRKPF